MSNKIKKELEKVEIPNELHERAKMGVDKAKSERPKIKLKKPLVAAAVVSLLGIGALSSPPIQAALEGIFEVSKYEDSSEKESISFGSGFSETGVVGEEVYTSLEQVEEIYNMNIPFPAKIWDIKSPSNTDEFRVGVDEEGNFISYNFDLSTDDKTHEQRFSITAIKSSKEKVNFDAETKDGTAINKDITVNDTKAKLFGVDKLAYSIYLEKDGWKLIITMAEKNDEIRTELTKAKEKQLIELAESIQ